MRNYYYYYYPRFIRYRKFVTEPNQTVNYGLAVTINTLGNLTRNHDF